MTNETFTDDDLVVPHFEDELWRVLAEAHEDRRRGTARLTPAVDRAHRRTGRRLVLSGIGAAAAAATLVVALSMQEGDDAPATPEPDESAAIPADLVAKVGAATAEANATMIVVMTTTSGVTYEAWADEVSGSVRMVIRNAAGEVVSDAHPATVPTDAPSDHKAVAFDYCAKTYTEVDALIDGAPNASFTDFVQTGLDTGTLVPDGTEVVDGKELIRLVEKPLPSSESVIGDVVEIVDDDGTTRTSIRSFEDAEPGVVWVDPETYRPVKYRDPALGSDKFYEYFERTPEKLAEMSPPVPAGFTHVDPPMGGIGPMPSC